MKKAMTILISICITSNLLSQEYFKFPTSNALWNYIIVGSMNPPYEWPVIDSLGQEITIGDQQYVEVYSVGLGSPYVVGAIKEDTILKKVYFHDFINKTEIVLYDFSVSIGDTVFYSEPYDYYKTVEDIYYVSINGQQRKMFYLENSLYSFVDYWIEGIGSVHRYGLLYPIKPYIVMDASNPYFGCFSHDTIIYINDSTCYGTCPCTGWLVNINEVKNNDSGITLYPNPTKNTITVDLSNSKSDYHFLEIFSCTGKLLLNKEITLKEKIDINLNFFTNGTYFLKLTGENVETIKKFVKVK